MNDLKGKKIIVTGASGGIGNSIVNKLNENGIRNTSIATNVSLLNEKRAVDLLEAGLGMVIFSIDSFLLIYFIKPYF